MRSNTIWQASIEGLKGLWPKRIIALVIVTSIIIVLFGLTFEKGPTQDISIDVVNLDESIEDSTAASVVTTMSSGATVHIVNSFGPSYGDAVQGSLDDLKAGKVEAVIVFGPNFTSDIQAWILAARSGTMNAPSSLTIYSDRSNPIASAAVQADVQRSLQAVLATSYQISSPVKVVQEIVYGDDTNMRDFMAPAIAGLLIFILTLTPSLMAKLNAVDRCAGRYSIGERLLAQCLSAFCIGIVLSATIMLVLGAFGIRMVGDLSVSIILLSSLAMASAALGQLIASFARGHREAMMVVFPLIFYPAILLSGIVLPLTSIPDYLLPISYLFPLTCSIEGVRLSMLNGFGWDVCWVQAAALFVYTVVCMTIAWWAERRSIDDHAASPDDGDISEGRADRAP